MISIFSLALDARDSRDDALVGEFFGGEVNIISSLAPIPEITATTLVNAQGFAERFEEATPFCQTLCPGLWPTADGGAFRSLATLVRQPPKSLSHWRMRNLILMLATGNLVYVVDELSTRTADVTVHLTAARALSVLSIGIMSAGLRANLDSAQLAMTDLVAVTEEPRTRSLVLRSLSQGR